MKKIVLLFFAIFLLSYTYAQRGLKLGAFVGPQLGYHLNADDATLPSGRFQAVPVWGTTGGLSVGYHFSDIIGVKIQAQYSQQGTALNFTDLEGEVTRFTQQLDYFKVPLMVGFNTNPLQKKLAFAFFAGPQFATLTRALQVNDDPSVDLVPDPALISRPSTFDLYTGNVWGLAIETGVDIQLSPEPIAFTIRYRQDFTFADIENKEQQQTFNRNGELVQEGFWQFFNGINGTRSEATQALTSGLTFGIIYTLAN